ncbi:MAG: sel1 repeat family protein [Opitutales bacterium]|nr:sel1 repeat family protein [Opitutales bacterium]
MKKLTQILLMGTVGCVPFLFADDTPADVSPRNEKITDLYTINLKSVVLSNKEEAPWGGWKDDPDIRIILEYKGKKAKTIVKKNVFAATFDHPDDWDWNNDSQFHRIEFPNRDIDTRSFVLTCEDVDLCSDDVIFSVVIDWQDVLKTLQLGDGRTLNVFVDRETGLKVEGKEEGTTHKLTFIVRKSSGPDVQWAIGQMYQYGKYCMKQDLDEAKHWYEKAAKAGHSHAQFDLGWSWYYDHKRDYKSALEWFEKAAKQNNPNACYLLGDCYSMGRGVSKDIPNAIRWYEKAEKLGNKDARTRINKLNQSK